MDFVIKMKLLYVLIGLSITNYTLGRSTLKHLHQNRQREVQHKVKDERIYEGDIFLDRSTQSLLQSLRRRPVRSAISSPNKKWSSNVIPYTFGGVSSRVREAVELAIRDIEEHTCIRFVTRKNEEDYIYIVSRGKYCWSSIGRSGGKQRLSLGKGCERKGTAIHEFMHALGFFHEQSRLDRDKYVTIYWNNIEKDQQFNFQKYNHGDADPLDLPYDYGSVMHYRKYAFTGNGFPTVVPKEKWATIGQRKGLSEIDIKKINKFYNCSAYTTASPTPKATAKPTDPPIRRHCRNRNMYCQRWASAGYCFHRNIRYRKYMQISCRKSCNLC